MFSFLSAKILRFALLLFLSIFMLTLTEQQGLAAAEQILAFDSVGVFAPDGSMEVTETLAVQVTGNAIKKGIYRKMPFIWHRADNKDFRLKYSVKSVSRNGVNEPYATSLTMDHITIRIGSAERNLPAGVHTYKIVYTIQNHFSRFDEWDELYWNVTGNEWGFAIAQASFSLKFADASGKIFPVEFKSIDYYTGVKGSKKHNARVLADNKVFTTLPLAAGEGLTVAYTWDKSILAGAKAPEVFHKNSVAWLPTAKTSWLLLFPVGIGAFFIGVRRRLTALAGGTLKQTVIPLFSPPDNIMPGTLRYAWAKRYDTTAFAADLLNFVGKGVLDIDYGAVPALTLSTKSNKKVLTAKLSAEEQETMRLLLSNKTGIDIDRSNRAELMATHNYLRSMNKSHKRDYFLRTGHFAAIGCILTAILPVLLGIFYEGLSAFFLGFIGVLLFGMLILSFELLKRVLGKSESSSSLMDKIIGCIALLPIVITLSVVAYSLLPVLTLFDIPDGSITCFLLSIVVLVVAGNTLPVCTPQGANLTAQAEGLRLYLGVAESTRFTELYPAAVLPKETVTHFETLLPYALALGVGKTWANRFESFLSRTGYSAEQFQNTGWSDVRSFVRSSAMASGFSSSSRSSGSGSGGRGSSGGGSGGGGGGGW